MKWCRCVDDPMLGMMLGVVLDRLGTVWTIGGEAWPDVMGDAVRQRLGCTWKDVSGAVVSSRWGLAISAPQPARM